VLKRLTETGLASVLKRLTETGFGRSVDVARDMELFSGVEVLHRPFLLVLARAIAFSQPREGIT
jgi:hypothetical protein